MNMPNMPKAEPVATRAEEKKLTDESIAIALLGHGTISAAARALRVHPFFISDRVNKAPHLRLLLDEHRARVVDDAENALHAAIQRGEAWAVTFALKTQGRRRGYTDREETRPGAGMPSLPELLKLATAAGGCIEHEQQKRMIAMEQTDTLRVNGNTPAGALSDMLTGGN